MERTKAVLITNIFVPYRYELFKAFTDQEKFDGIVLFIAESYGDVNWDKQLDESIKYSILGGRLINSTTSKIPVSFNLSRKLFELSPKRIVLSEFSPLNVLQILIYKLFTILFRRRIKIIIMTDENRVFFNKLSYKFIRRFIRKLTLVNSDFCICSSKETEKHILNLEPSIKGRTCISYLTPESVYYQSKSKCLEMNRKSEDLRIITVCRLVKQKRVDRLIKAAKLLSDMELEKSWNVDVIGDGPELSYLVDLVEQNNLQDKIRFKGRKVGSELREIYSCSDIFVLTSDHEAWGVVVHEAMLSGLATIVTKSIGASEIVKGSGIVIDDESKEEREIVTELSQKLYQIINNDEELTIVKNSCFKKAGEISIGKQIEQFLNAI